MPSEPTPVALRGKADPTRLAVTGVGSALLDIIAQDRTEAFRDFGFVKGSMSLVDEDLLPALYASMGPTLEMSGGSVANSIAGVAALGGTSGFIGRVGDDDFGRRFAHDLRSLGVELDLTIDSSGQTGRCHVYISDDAQRTMATHLGVANRFHPNDVSEQLIARSEIVFIEGYLFDLPPAKKAVSRIAELAHQHDAMLALSLSDSFCVDRHRADFLELVTHDVDVLLANEQEILSLFQVASLADAYDSLRAVGVLAAVTRGPHGVDVLVYDEVTTRPAADVPVVDQNGAGDLFAAGFLFGLALGNDPLDAADLGSLCAGEVITHLGARPEADLQQMALEAGLL